MHLHCQGVHGLIISRRHYLKQWTHEHVFAACLHRPSRTVGMPFILQGQDCLL